MIIDELLLTMSLGPIFVYGLLERKASPLVGAGIVLVASAMLLAAWFPGPANAVAAVLGLDGSQLLFVLGISIVLLIVLNLHLKNRRVMGAVTALTREIAVDGAHSADGGTRRAAHGPATLQAPVESVRPQQKVARAKPARQRRPRPAGALKKEE